MRRWMNPFLVGMTALGLATWSLAEGLRHPSTSTAVSVPAIADTTLAGEVPAPDDGVHVASFGDQAVQGVEKR